MHLSYIFLLGVALFTLPMLAIKAQYDDDTTPRKVRLEDLEADHDDKQQQSEQLQQFTQQQLPLLPDHNNNNNNNQQRPAAPPQPITSTYRGAPPTHSPLPPPPLSVRPLEQHVTAPPRPRLPASAHSDYETASANRYSLGVRPFGNGLANDADLEDIDDLRRDPPQQQQQPTSQDDVITFSHDVPLLQQLLHRQQLSGGYALKHEPAPFVLVPPFGVAAASDQNPAAHNHRFEGPTAAAPPPVAPYHQLRRPLPPPPNKPFGVYLPNEPAPSSSLQYAAAAGVQYVNNNNLGDEDALPPFAGDGAIEYAREHFSPNRPQNEYGSPHANFRRPNFPPAPPQSNQLAYAPQRPEAGSLSTGAVKIPYPPSFISITTRRPQHYNAPPVAVRPLSGRAFYGRDFEASQADPVPDFFTHRQPKSLLDSYIPSWVVAKMLQQQPRHGPGFNTLAFTSATPFNRHYKRELTPKTDRDNDFSQKIVKKSLNAQSEKEEMLMTA